MTLQGKVAIITGSSRGIGRAIANRLSRDGAAVVINYVGREQQAREAVQEIEKNGGRAIALAADVSKSADVGRLFDATMDKFGHVDILVNNAGVILYKLLADTSEADFDRLFAINAKGTFLACQQAAKRLADNGRIVNFSSSTTAMMLPTYGTYVATKGAVEQMSHVLAREVGIRGITVNVVSPGPTETELFMTNKSDEDIQRAAKSSAFGRLGQPQDIAGVVAWLVSDDARWVTGQNIRANGGLI